MLLFGKINCRKVNLMLSKFLDPKNDVCFRKIFGTEKNKDILIHFLKEKGRPLDLLSSGLSTGGNCGVK